jgi:hypothetical protein
MRVNLYAACVSRRSWSTSPRPRYIACRILPTVLLQQTLAQCICVCADRQRSQATLSFKFHSGAACASIVLRHSGRHIVRAARCHETNRGVAFISTHRYGGTGESRSIRKRLRGRVSLGRAVGLFDLRVHHQSMPIVGQHVTHVARHRARACVWLLRFSPRQFSWEPAPSSGGESPSDFVLDTKLLCPVQA